MSSTHAHALFAAATWNAVRQLLSLDRNDNNNNKTVVKIRTRKELNEKIKKIK